MMIRSILAATDFSPQADDAVAEAAALARRFDAKLTIVHVYAPPGVLVPDGFVAASPQATRDLLEAVERGLAKVRERVAAPGLTIDTIAVQGAAATEIDTLALERGVDLVVVATHGRTGFKRLLLGSVAERVVREAPCPVLVVRGHHGPAEARA